MHANITATLEPFFAGLFAYFVLGDTMEGWQVIGGVIVIASVVFLQSRPNRA